MRDCAKLAILISERSCVRRTSRSTRSARKTFGFAERLRLVFDAAALRAIAFSKKTVAAWNDTISQ